MIKQATPEKLEVLKSRVERSKKIMRWERDKVWSQCRDFFEGNHWPASVQPKMKTINLIWATVKTLLADQYYRNPKFTLKALKPEFEGNQRFLQEAVLNYYVKRSYLKPVARNCVQSAFTDMAIMTWGCDTRFEDSGATKKDSFYFKQIEAENFFPDHSNKERIFEKLEGFAIKESMRVSDVANKWNVDKKNIVATDMATDDMDDRTDYHDGFMDQPIQDDIKRVQVYRYYDNYERKQYIYGKGSYDFFDIIDYEDKEPPYAVLKYNEKTKGFYPIPEILFMIDPQKIIEISASMSTEHMLRSARKIQVEEENMEAAEEDKLEDPTTGVIVHVKKIGRIAPIDMGTADSSIYNNVSMFGNFFDQIGGLNTSRRGGGSQKLTATAEAIIDKHGMNRSSDKLSQLADFMVKVGKGFHDCLQENLTIPDVIQVTSEEGAMQWFSYIPTIDITGDYECEVQVGEMGVKDDAVERSQWIQVLAVLQQSPMILQSPLLVEETLARFHITNPALKKEIVKIGQQMLQQQQMEMASKAGVSVPDVASNAGQIAGAAQRV